MITNLYDYYYSALVTFQGFTIILTYNSSGQKYNMYLVKIKQVRFKILLHCVFTHHSITL